MSSRPASLGSAGVRFEACVAYEPRPARPLHELQQVISRLLHARRLRRLCDGWPGSSEAHIVSRSPGSRKGCATGARAPGEQGVRRAAGWMVRGSIRVAAAPWQTPRQRRASLRCPWSHAITTCSESYWWAAHELTNDASSDLPSRNPTRPLTLLPSMTITVLGAARTSCMASATCAAGSISGANQRGGGCSCCSGSGCTG